MKKIIFSLISLCIFALLFGLRAHAVTPTDSPTPTDAGKTTASPTPSGKIIPTDEKNDAEQSIVQKMKERVAKRVSELKLVEKRGITGVVKDVSSTQITIEGENHKQRIVDIDELTKFNQSPGSTKTFGVSDIKAGDSLAFIGLYNKDTKRLLARFVTKISSIPSRLSGIVKSKNPKEYTLVLITSDGKEHMIDIQTSTVIQVFTAESPAKSGFSKIQEGERIFVIGFPDLKNENLFEASRIIYFTDLPPSQEMEKHAGVSKKVAPTQEP